MRPPPDSAQASHPEGTSGAGVSDTPFAFLYTFGALGFVSAAALALNVILARVLSVEDIGHIRLVRTVFDMLAIAGGLGMGACVAKHVAEDRATDSDRRRYLATAILIALAWGAVVALCGAAAVRIPGILQDEVALGILRWLVLLIPAVSALACLQGYLQGGARLGRLAASQVAWSTAALVGCAALAAAFGVDGWAMGRVVGEVTGLGLAAWFVYRLVGGLRRHGAGPDKGDVDVSGRRATPGEPHMTGQPLADGQEHSQSGKNQIGAPRPDAALLLRFARFGGYAALTNALTILITSIDVLCLDRLRGDAAEIGLYGIATLAAATLYLLPSAYGQSQYAAMVAGAYDPERAWRAMVSHTTRLGALVVPAAVAAWFCAPLIEWAFGADYAQSVEIFRWLVPAFVVRSAGTVGSSVIIGAGLMRQTFLSSVATVCLNLVLNLALIPRYGVAGAVAATTASYALRTGLSFVILAVWRARNAERSA